MKDLSEYLNKVDSGNKRVPSEIYNEMQALKVISFLTEYHIQKKQLEDIFNRYNDENIDLKIKLTGAGDGLIYIAGSAKLANEDWYKYKPSKNDINRIYNEIEEVFRVSIGGKEHWYGLLSDMAIHTIKVTKESVEKLDNLFLNAELKAKYQNAILSNQLKDNNLNKTKKMKV